MSEQVGRRRTDVWVFRPIGASAWYRATTVSLALLAGTILAVEPVLPQPWHRASCSVLASVAGAGAINMTLTRYILRRFRGAADAYFLGFQEGFRLAEGEELDPALVEARMRTQADARLRLISGPDEAL